ISGSKYDSASSIISCHHAYLGLILKLFQALFKERVDSIRESEKSFTEGRGCSIRLVTDQLISSAGAPLGCLLGFSAGWAIKKIMKLAPCAGLIRPHLHIFHKEVAFGTFHSGIENK